MRVCVLKVMCFFFQAEDGIRDLVRSRGLGDVYKRQGLLETTRRISALSVPSQIFAIKLRSVVPPPEMRTAMGSGFVPKIVMPGSCLLYTSDAADDLLCVDLGGRRIIKKKNKINYTHTHKLTPHEQNHNKSAKTELLTVTTLS